MSNYFRPESTVTISLSEYEQLKGYARLKEENDTLFKAVTSDYLVYSMNGGFCFDGDYSWRFTIYSKEDLEKDLAKEYILCDSKRKEHLNEIERLQKLLKESKAKESKPFLKSIKEWWNK